MVWRDGTARSTMSDLLLLLLLLTKLKVVLRPHSESYPAQSNVAPTCIVLANVLVNFGERSLRGFRESLVERICDGKKREF